MTAVYKNLSRKVRCSIHGDHAGAPGVSQYLHYGQVGAVEGVTLQLGESVAVEFTEETEEK